jgi:Uncharacterized protein conserved in bacteria (DUF2252)
MADTTSSKSKAVPHLTVPERAAKGRAARAEVPRSKQAEIELPAPRDPIALLEEQSVSRVPELVPIRYGRMVASPFAFYRGAALIMASDLARTPSSGLRAQLCGDAHLDNFGLFGSPERDLVFDVNDFDESAPGPWEWDVKRLAASFAIGGRENGFSAAHSRDAVLASVSSYRVAMAGFARMNNLQVWYSSLPAEKALHDFKVGVDPKRLKKAQADVAKSRTKNNLQELEKLTRLVDGEPRIISDPPLIVPVAELVAADDRESAIDEVRGLVRSYRRTLETDRRALLETFRLVDVARKVVGVGSVGTRAWIALFLGSDEHDPLFLQIKEAQRSVLEQFVGKSEYTNCGQRVVAAQRLMQATSDIFLGWQHASAGLLDGRERDFYVRQLKDWKGSFAFEAANPAGAVTYGRICGWTLARAHARSGDRVAIASYLGSGDAFDRAIASFAESYADQNQRDYDALKQAVASGRIAAQTGV